MLLRPFGATGVAVPVIGQGTWDIPEGGARLRDAKASLLRGIELGMTHIDTAEMYGTGRAEEIVGETIAGIERAKLFIASKVLPGNATFSGTIAACEQSLRRLKIDYLDLYLLHWPSHHPLEETMGALERLVQDGKTRFIGVSNFDLEDLRTAESYLRSAPIACNQVLYHVNERAIELRLMPYCRAHNIAIVAYTPFGRGRFRDTVVGGVMEGIARKHGATPRQVILNFLTRDDGTFTIPKASQLAHVADNARAVDFRLDAVDVAAIEAAFPVRDGPLATL
ncbi:MAG: aldo/keto reductase [Candidatus Eremiobacteraeota bacterium]|nr:aldo/keto reductase [Candidatus Eremiobacteraeota bacterium]